MNDQISSNQLVITDRPIAAWSIAVVMFCISFVVLFIKQLSIASVIILAASILLIILNPETTITADSTLRTLTKTTHWIFGKRTTEFSFNEIAGFDVQTSRSQSSTRSQSTSYRLILIKTTGERVPLQFATSSSYGVKAQQAQDLTRFLNLPGWEDKPTNLFQTAMQTQVAMTKNPAMAQEGTTSGVSWNIEVHSIGDKPVTHWISGDFTCPGDFLLVSQKPANSPSMVGGGGLLGSLVSMAYKQILGLYGFLPSDAPGYDSAVPVPSGDTLFDRNFATMTSSLSFGKSLLNPWTITPFDHWAEKYPLKTVNANDQVGQLAVLYSPRGVQVAILGLLPPNEFDEIIALGVELVKAQGGGKPAG
ncbi:hypothetical protein [Leptolinea tardivitalis]|uniref:Uncharacterized protein n=1 Tax=Leptolinea tardivitalis TaxID=229920 RepID=A0A0P6XNW8_9CHLR|nr:hypothetical protein [Leptolinea tardivitalis]KPL70704.1 hypothetical protein ADM99_16605 [Leptolinea tardivitalis]GAP22336.1 hypothetical protein LTAR_02567 [Leptolinea tardivitalis]